MPMQVIDGADLSDLQRLSVLQHQGAGHRASGLYRESLVALWIACTEKPDRDGRVSLARRWRSASRPKRSDVGQPIRCRTNCRVLRTGPFAWGANCCAAERVCDLQHLIPAQHLKSVAVPQSSKEPLQLYLTRLGLSHTSLFGDIPGLARRIQRTPLQRTEPLTPEQYRDRGNRAYQAGRYDDALAAYEAYEVALPDVAQPYCLKGTHSPRSDDSKTRT